MTETVHDEEAMGAYGRAAMPTLAKAGGRAIVVTPNTEVLEGDWQGSQTVVLEFDSVEAARDWYHSPEYQEVIGLRHAAAACNLVIVPGLTSRDR